MQRSLQELVKDKSSEMGPGGEHVVWDPITNKNPKLKAPKEEFQLIIWFSPKLEQSQNLHIVIYYC